MGDETLYRQCTLTQVYLASAPGESRIYRPLEPRTTTACWLPSAGLKVGMIVSLKLPVDSKAIWHVTGISPGEMPRDALHIDWDADWMHKMDGCFND